MFNFNYPSSMVFFDAVERIKILSFDFFDMLNIDPMTAYLWFMKVESTTY